ncbi:putative ribosomal protein S21 [Rosa chinensis]|uniref:Putative ribosomal protein S21 n=1 Tax=Rosa chinensis TaxID=74649 RepID=A0A2P6RJ51_ROSCH|nr:30S ribosomal protein S21, chloroplastic [Rosa chinensis]XP_040371638.1 30S ribosomal protein S21, chloroplastic [Rosa chinensis]PRQ46421.1 putative ribosomal protein S21 [Rosa chinensis]PRQ46426.1 putative ribosomal protein S21 [Rosa chinensis]
MAASSSLCNFLSFLTPSKPPSQAKPPPPHLHLSQTQKPRDAFVPLVAQPGPYFSSSSSELESVMNASLAYANTLFFKSAYNGQVIVDEGESEERLLNRFRREVMRAGVIQEVKRRRYFQNTQD